MAVRGPRHARSATCPTGGAREIATPRDAIQYADVAGGSPILLGSRNLVVAEQGVDRLKAAGVELAHLCEFELPNGQHRIVTIPVP